MICFWPADIISLSSNDGHTLCILTDQILSQMPTSSRHPAAHLLEQTPETKTDQSRRLVENNLKWAAVIFARVNENFRTLISVRQLNVFIYVPVCEEISVVFGVPTGVCQREQWRLIEMHPDTRGIYPLSSAKTKERLQRWIPHSHLHTPMYTYTHCYTHILFIIRHTLFFFKLHT